MTHDHLPGVAGHHLTEAEAVRAVSESLHRIVPDADIDAIGPDASFRTELELDSLDFLSFVDSLSQRTGVRIDEIDYPRLATLSSCTEFLVSAS